MRTKIEIKESGEAGITLIALVVTIVVLLILAGVSISLVLNNNGIISKAKEAKNQYTEAQTNDEKQLNELTDWINATTKNTKENSDYDPATEGIPIPEGYYYVGGKKATGVVISDAKADEKLDAGKENVRKELSGNQWVWVPVENPSSMYVTVTNGVELSGDTGVKTTKYTASGRTSPGDTGIREPDLDSGNDATNYTTAGFSSLANMAESMVNDYEEMISSLEKYKGFYIGRYELSVNGEKTGATQRNMDWYTLYKNCTTLAKDASKVKTRMIWGLQWDATCNWLESSGINMEDATSWGNCNNESGAEDIVDTGFSENWKANNIYDFAGNCYEFTQEAVQTECRAIRGSGYGTEGTGTSPKSMTFDINTQTYSDSSTRPILYLIQ